MNILSLSDNKLNALWSEVNLEVRRRVSASACDDLALIKGQEMAKRALTVAACGGHSILFVGPPNCGKTMLRAAAIRLGNNIAAFEARPCPCGYYGAVRKPCNCTAEKIEKKIATFPITDICIEVPEVPEREMRSQTPGTSTADVMGYIKNCAACKAAYPGQSLALDNDSAIILKAAVTELGIDADARTRILLVARTIANMDKQENIRAHHLCEAVNYRMYTYRKY